MKGHVRTVHMTDSNGSSHVIQQTEKNDKEELDRINDHVMNFKIPSDSELDTQLNVHEAKLESQEAFEEEERIHKDEEFMKKYVV